MSFIDKKTYNKLIESDIDVLMEYIPEEYSIERDHMILVLRQSIDLNYPQNMFNPKEE